MDVLSKEQRSKLMSSINSKNTKLEDIISRGLWERGVRFRKNVGTLVGKPDIAIKKYKIVIFIDSCFWHGCHLHGRIPKTNTEFWINKIKKNKQRDTEVSCYYTNKEWNILRIWEHEIKENPNKAINIIIEFINICKRK